MKIKLTKASNDFEKEVEITTLSDLIDLIKAEPCGSAVISTREIGKYEAGQRGLKPVYRDLDELEVMIYDGPIE